MKAHNQEKDDAIKKRIEKIAQTRKAILKSDAASLFGALGGMSGTGAAKRRDPEVYERAAKKRWENHHKKVRNKIKAD